MKQDSCCVLSKWLFHKTGFMFVLSQWLSHEKEFMVCYFPEVFT